MLTARQLVQCRVAVELKIASLKRGMNTAREPAFKALYESELADYTQLQMQLMKGLSDVQVPQEDVKGKK